MVQLAFYYKELTCYFISALRNSVSLESIVDRMTALLTTTFFFIKPQRKNFTSGTSEYQCSFSVAYKTIPRKEDGWGCESWNLAIGPRVLVCLDSPAVAPSLVCFSYGAIEKGRSGWPLHAVVSNMSSGFAKEGKVIFWVAGFLATSVVVILASLERKGSTGWGLTVQYFTPAHPAWEISAVPCSSLSPVNAGVHHPPDKVQASECFP